MKLITLKSEYHLNLKYQFFYSEFGIAPLHQLSWAIIMHQWFNITVAMQERNEV